MRRVRAKVQVLQFLAAEGGQDLTEFALLIAFLCVGGAALFLGQGDSIRGIWAVTSNNLDSANKVS